MHITERRALALTLPPSPLTLSLFFLALHLPPPVSGRKQLYAVLVSPRILWNYRMSDNLVPGNLSLCLLLRARQESAESCVFLQVAGEKHANDDSIKSNDKGKTEHFTSFTHSSVAADFQLFTASSLKEGLDLHSLPILTRLNPGKRMCIHGSTRMVLGDHASGFEGPFIDCIFVLCTRTEWWKEKTPNSSFHNLDGKCWIWSLQSSESPFKVWIKQKWITNLALVRALSNSVLVFLCLVFFVYFSFLILLALSQVSFDTDRWFSLVLTWLKVG